LTKGIIGWFASASIEELPGLFVDDRMRRLLGRQGDAVFSIRRLSVLAGAGISIIILAGCGASASPAKQTSTSPSVIPTPLATVRAAPTPVVTGAVAAVVNGHSIPISKFRTYLGLLARSSQGARAPQGAALKTLADQAMTEVIYDQLIADFAGAHHISVGTADLDKQQAKDLAQAGGASAFQSRIRAAGLTVSAYRALVYPNILAQKVEQYLYPIQAKAQPYAHVEHILISLKPASKPARTDAAAKALAAFILKQIQQGANFATLARKYSDDPGSAAQGGDLGKVSPGQTVAPFNHAAFALPLDQPAIVHSQFGYHVLEVLARGVGPAQPSQQAQQNQRTKFLAWLKKQEAQAKITRVAKVR
jgi:parvulin-like peptidyl-prolyl isomerase